MHANTVKGTLCKRWNHKPYRGVCGNLSVVVGGLKCKGCDGTMQEADLSTKDIVMDGEIYESLLWKTLLMDMVELSLRQQLESEMDGKSSERICHF